MVKGDIIALNMQVPLGFVDGGITGPWACTRPLGVIDLGSFGGVGTRCTIASCFCLRSSGSSGRGDGADPSGLSKGATELFLLAFLAGGTSASNLANFSASILSLFFRCMYSG